MFQLTSISVLIKYQWKSFFIHCKCLQFFHTLSSQRDKDKERGEMKERRKSERPKVWGFDLSLLALNVMGGDHESEDAGGLQKLSATPVNNLQETGAWVLQSHKKFCNNLNEPGASPDKISVLWGPLYRNYWHPWTSDLWNCEKIYFHGFDYYIYDNLLWQLFQQKKKYLKTFFK